MGLFIGGLVKVAGVCFTQQYDLEGIDNGGFSCAVLSGQEVDVAYFDYLFAEIQPINQLDSFWNESDIFYILYTASVGIERLQKVLLVLSEDITEENIGDFEETLITHSHQDLHKRIQDQIGLSFNSNQNKLLTMLTSFYKSCRYDRFTFGDSYQKEKDLLIEYPASGLNCEIIADSFVGNTPNNRRFKKYYCKNLGSIASAYHSWISRKAREQNICTYELPYNSSAGKIFLSRYEDGTYYKLFEQEELTRKEYLLFLIQKADDTAWGKFIKSISPLELDEALYNSYASALISGRLSLSDMDEVEAEYSYEVENKKERLKMLDVLGNPLVYLEEEFDDETEYYPLPPSVS